MADDDDDPARWAAFNTPVEDLTPAERWATFYALQEDDFSDKQLAFLREEYPGLSFHNALMACMAAWELVGGKGADGWKYLQALKAQRRRR
jgi:hypothetical protein